MRKRYFLCFAARLTLNQIDRRQLFKKCSKASLHRNAQYDNDIFENILKNSLTWTSSQVSPASGKTSPHIERKIDLGFRRAGQGDERASPCPNPVDCNPPAARHRPEVISESVSRTRSLLPPTLTLHSPPIDGEIVKIHSRRSTCADAVDLEVCDQRSRGPSEGEIRIHGRVDGRLNAVEPR